MIKTNVKMQFLGYKNNSDGELVRVDKSTEDMDQSRLPRLTLSGFENGMWTGKDVTGQINLLKDEFHDLLNGEALEGWAIFALKITD